MRVAALDMGSNTTLLLIAEVEGGVVREVLLDETRITKLGQGVHSNRKFHPEAMERMRECLSDYGQKIKKLNCGHVAAVATSAARDVSNGHELIAMAKSFGIPVHIIEGKREADLTYRGALSDRSDHSNIAVIDVGGGSTEIILSDGEGIQGHSIDVGSVRLTEMFIKGHPIRTVDLAETRAFVSQQFKKTGLNTRGIQEVVAVAGTPTTLAALNQQRDFSENLVNGYKLTIDGIENWISKLAAMTISEREKLPGMQPKRADVIVTGALILAGAIRALGQEQITVSTRGVRYGVALAWQQF